MIPSRSHYRPKAPSLKGLRLLLPALLLLCCAFLLFGRPGYRQATYLGEDFVEYWAAARLNLAGRNPYNATNMLAVQQTLSPALQQARMSWNPPQTLLLATPFALIEYGRALLLWRVLGLAAVLSSAAALWRHYGGRREHTWLALALAGLYLPTFIMIAYGQLGGLILVGLAGFLVFERARKDWLAGAALCLASVKPQITLVFWLILLLWIVRERRWGVLAGLAGGWAGLTLPSVAANPQLLSQYLAAARANPVADWITPTLGALLRQTLGWRLFWLQFAGLPPAALLAAWLWRRQGKNWCWTANAPWVLLLSTLASPYGWIHDWVILLIPAVAVVASGRSLARSGLAALTAASLLMPLVFTAHFPGLTPHTDLTTPTQAWNFWGVAALAGWWLLSGAAGLRPRASLTTL